MISCFEDLNGVYCCGDWSKVVAHLEVHRHTLLDISIWEVVWEAVQASWAYHRRGLYVVFGCRFLSLDGATVFLEFDMHQAIASPAWAYYILPFFLQAKKEDWIMPFGLCSLNVVSLEELFRVEGGTAGARRQSGSGSISTSEGTESFKITTAKMLSAKVCILLPLITLIQHSSSKTFWSHSVLISPTQFNHI